LFSSGIIKSDEINFHPCVPCLIKDVRVNVRVRDEDIISIHDKRVTAYIRKSIDSLTPDQSNILSATVAKKNIIVVAPAGSGKTHVLKIINVIYRLHLGSASVIVTAMFNIIATSIHGKTLHSFLKLGCATAATVGRYIYNENSDLNDFILECYKDPRDMERLEHIRRAVIMIIDEVIFNLCFHCY
jgi:energy-coupling factor transporter ATP-binding protein EcfA2